VDKRIIDNFLNEDEFLHIKNLIDNPFFSWYFQNGREFVNDKFFQFTHVFYHNNRPNSQEFDSLQPFIDKLKMKSIVRIKANITGKEETIKDGQYHVDFDDYNCTTAIWYLNTNNGKTVFEDGDEVESVANRMVIFPGHIKHFGTSHTDTKVRIVLNFNYY
jgi:hypothetical protein